MKAETMVKHPEWLNDPQYYHNQGDSFWQGESSLNGDFSGLDDLKPQMQTRLPYGSVQSVRWTVKEFPIHVTFNEKQNLWYL